MIWLNPAVLVALGVIAAPILIHLLVQRRAERFPFPTLQFLKPARLAAIRRHVLEDAALLAVRAAILAAAVAAVAGPLVLTSARRQAWERRIVRAVVVDAAAPGQASGDAQPPALYRSRQFTGASLRDSILRAVAWLEQAPPARRELVIVSPLTIGSIDGADVAAIPESIGIRFERNGELPPTRTVAAGHVIGPARPEVRRDDTGTPPNAGAEQSFRAAQDITTIARQLTFAGAETIVRDLPSADAAAWPIDLVHAPDATPAVDAAQAAVRQQRVRAPAPDRRVRLVIGTGPHSVAATAGATVMSRPWMADASARIARDADLQAAASRVALGMSDARFAAGPWQTLASAADGRPLVTVAGTASHLLVVSAAPVTEIATPILMRSIANAVAPALALERAEVVPIAGPQLQQWSRPAPAPAAPGTGSLRQGEDDDRRWFWLSVLILIGAETWMRRARTSAAEPGRGHREETARVA